MSRNKKRLRKLKEEQKKLESWGMEVAENSDLLLSGEENKVKVKNSEIQRKKKNSDRTYNFFARIVLFLTAMSSLLTGYEIVYQFNQNNFNNSSNNSLSLNGTNFNNSTISNFESANINLILNKVNLTSSIASLIPQIAFLVISTVKLDYEFFSNNSIKKYIKNNFENSSNFFKALIKLITLKNPKDSERYIEENYAKYIVYKLIEVQDPSSAMQIKILDEFLTNLRGEKKILERKKTRYRPEINVFLFRLFENSEYEIKKRKLKIVEKSLEMLKKSYDNFDQIEKKDIKKFVKEYENHSKKISKYSASQALFWTAITQNLVLLAQTFDAIVTTFSTVGPAFTRDAFEFFQLYTLLALGNGTSWMLYNAAMSKQKEHEVLMKNTSELLNLETIEDLKFVLTQIMNPSLSVKNIRKEQSYFGSMNWFLLPIFAYFSSLGYSHFLDNRHYENTTVVRSLSVLTMATFLKRIEVFLKLFEQEDNKSQLGKLSAVLTINILMPQGVFLSFIQMMRNHGVNKYALLTGDLFANIVCGFMNTYLNVLSQKYTSKEAENNLNNVIDYIESEGLSDQIVLDKENRSIV